MADLKQLSQLNQLQVNQDAAQALRGLGERLDNSRLHLVQLLEWAIENPEIPLQNEDQRLDLQPAVFRLERHNPAVVLEWLAGSEPDHVPLKSDEPKEAARQALDLLWMAMTPDSE